MAISVDFDELPQNAASHLGLLCLIFHVEMLLGINGSTLILAIFFGPENSVSFLHLLLLRGIQIHFTLLLFMEANNMNPDQTALKGAV